MSLAIFAFGVVVFLIAVYRTVVEGVFRTGFRLDEQPELLPEASRPHSANAGTDRASALVRSEF
jgi:hypothetical protein